MHSEGFKAGPVNNSLLTIQKNPAVFEENMYGEDIKTSLCGELLERLCPDKLERSDPFKVCLKHLIVHWED